jgi:hypothetical protein
VVEEGLEGGGKGGEGEGRQGEGGEGEGGEGGGGAVVMGIHGWTWMARVVSFSEVLYIVLKSPLYSQFYEANIRGQIYEGKYTRANVRGHCTVLRECVFGAGRISSGSSGGSSWVDVGGGSREGGGGGAANIPRGPPLPKRAPLKPHW